jgi:hypothetical protein
VGLDTERPNEAPNGTKKKVDMLTHGKKNTTAVRLRALGSYRMLPWCSPPMDLFDGGAEFSWRRK